MSRARFIPWLLAAAVASASLMAGACRNPRSLCEEYIDWGNNLGDRCGLISGEDDFPVPNPRNPAQTGCGWVASVSNPREIVQDCFEYFRTVPCDDETLDDFPANLPDVCLVESHFLPPR